MARKDKIVTPSVTQKLQELGYNVADWDDSKTESKLNKDIIKALSKASKEQTGKQGFPDRIYFSKKENLLILVEEKPNIRQHNLDNIKDGAIAGIKWFLSFFNNKIFSEYKILGIAVSGDLYKEYEHKFTCFIIEKNEIKLLPQITNFIPKNNFLAVFNNFNEEEAIIEISRVSKKINKLLRNIDSQKRPILLSVLMISLYKTPNNNFSKKYPLSNGSEILGELYPTVERVLLDQKIPLEKILVLKGELESIKNDKTLCDTEILKDILTELDTIIIPLIQNRFSTNSNYDIMGRFYEEFLRYAGVSNVKKGIVLTPRHITTLFTKLIPIKTDDIIVDICCGTGAFLIAGMNKIISMIEKSERTDKVEAIKKVKENQLLGFELNTTMYICAISNMLFRGDGKSKIYNLDSINDTTATEILNKVKPTIGFINPPYSGKENKEDPTPKEITFLKKLLDNCSKYVIVIAPLSMYFKDDKIREEMLKKHSLKYVINMPKDLFQPNAMSHTAIAVFETNIPHNYEEDVIFYDLRDDGFVLSKNKGRTDFYNKWIKIEKQLINTLNGNGHFDDIISIRKKISRLDEWCVYAHSKNDYSNLSVNDFIKTIFDYLIFKFKKENDLLEISKNELEILSLINKLKPELINIELLNKVNLLSEIDTSLWKEFCVKKSKNNDTMIVETTPAMIEKQEGDIPYISRSSKNNGLIGFASSFDIRKNEEYTLNEGNCITIGAEGIYAFYQEDSFISGVKIYTLRNQKMNVYNALFIVTLLNKIEYKYSYGRARTKDRILKESILLPKNINGDVDWEFMEEYIKSLPYSKFL